jgi:YidC/Oxa1 family membrane protein insertase
MWALRRTRAPRVLVLCRRRLASSVDLTAAASSPSSAFASTLLLDSDALPTQVDSPATLAATAAASVAPAATAPPPLTLWPADLALRAVETVHSSADLPWWGAIVGCTVLIRAALLPLALHGSQQQAKMQSLRTELAPLQSRLQASGFADQAAAAQISALYERHNVSPYKMVLLPFAQLPIFMSFFLGLRRLAETFPDARTGGAFWFVDLGACDDSYWLPTASCVSALALVNLSMPAPPAGDSRPSIGPPPRASACRCTPLVCLHGPPFLT